MAVIRGERQAVYHGKKLPVKTTGGRTTPRLGWEQLYDQRKTAAANRFGLRVKRNDPSLRAPNDLLGRFLGDVPQLAKGTLEFPFQAWRAQQQDEGALLHGRLPKHSLGLLKQQAQGVKQTVQHPLRHPGFTLATAAALTPFGRVAAGRLGAGVESYGGVGGLTRTLAHEQRGEIGTGRLNPSAVDALRRIAHSKPDDLEQMVAESKLGIAHHGTPYPFAADELVPQAKTPTEVPRAYLTPSHEKALRFAREKSASLGSLSGSTLFSRSLDDAPWDRHLNHPISDKIGAAIQELDKQGNYRAPASELKLPNGEPLLAPRVHSYFVDARNPIQLGDVPNPGAVELIREMFDRENQTAGFGQQRSLIGLADWQKRFEGAPDYQELFSRISQRLPQRWPDWQKQGFMEDVLRKAVGADAIVSRGGNILMPSTTNLWKPEVAQRAQELAALRAHAGSILAADARGEKPFLTAAQARDFAEALRQGKVGPLRERIMLKNVLDTPGVGKRYYRGVATAYKKESPQAWNPHSLHGPGAYHTDSPEVAESYIGATNAGEGTGNIRMVSPLSGSKGLWNLDKMTPEPVMERLSRAIHDFHERKQQRFPGNGLSLSGEGARRSFESAFKNEDGTWGNDYGSDIRDWLDHRYGPDNARRIMAKAGIRVLEHEGGRVMGGYGSHNVRIALKPSAAQPYFQSQKLLHGFAQAIKALEAAAGMKGATAADKAAYLRSYMTTLAQELDRRTGPNPQLEKNLARPASAADRLHALRAVYRYPEIRRDFGNEGAVLFARAWRAGMFKTLPEMQQVANNILDTARHSAPPLQRGMGTKDLVERQLEERRRYATSLLRKVLAERQHGHLENVYPSGGYPY